MKNRKMSLLLVCLLGMGFFACSEKKKGYTVFEFIKFKQLDEQGIADFMVKNKNIFIRYAEPDAVKSIYELYKDDKDKSLCYKTARAYILTKASLSEKLYEGKLSTAVESKVNTFAKGACDEGKVKLLAETVMEAAIFN